MKWPEGDAMDNLFDKMGLYDFFGILIPGMFFLGAMIVIDLPILDVFYVPDSGTVFVILFVVFSYILGSLIQEVGSLADKKRKLWRYSASKKFLSDSEFGKKEIKDIEDLVYKTVGKQKDGPQKEILNEEDCRVTFFECKAKLENQGKMDKADRLDAIYCMSRDFIVCNLGILIVMVLSSAWDNIVNKLYKVDVIDTTYDVGLIILVLFYCFVSSYVFGIKASRYAKIRVRTILRQNISLVKEKNR